MTKLCDTCEYLRYCARSGIEEVGCDRYKKDMTTNEEWFCQLDTEDKAREISDMTAQGYWSEELVERWLKEKHTS